MSLLKPTYEKIYLKQLEKVAKKFSTDIFIAAVALNKDKPISEVTKSERSEMKRMLFFDCYGSSDSVSECIINNAKYNKITKL